MMLPSNKRLLNKAVQIIHYQTRLTHTFTVNNVTETIYTRDDYPLDKCRTILQQEKVCVLGYGPQGQGQSLNLRDNGIDVCVGLRKNGKSWQKAVNDGWVANDTLFEIDEACHRGTVIQYLLSDAAQIEMWPVVKPNLTSGDALYFSHGFGIVYKDQTSIIPPTDVDVILAAPKGPGGLVRRKFLEKSGINSSFAIFQNATGNALDRILALTFGIGTLNAFETTFEAEVYSDLTGERSCLMGLIQGAFKAQYDVLRANGHSPSEAFNETVEEALVSLYPLVNENGMDWMYRNCSTTAQRGALDWSKKFEKAVKPVIEECYASVKSGKEAEITIAANKSSDYREKLEAELKEMDEQEIWQVGKILRELRNKSISDTQVAK